MTCPDEERLGALVAGELSAGEAAALDEHLLACEECWRAVQEGRGGRLAVDRLREAAPPGLADRIVAAIELDIRQQETNVHAFSATATPDGEATSAQGPEHGVALGLPGAGRVPAAHRHRAGLALAAVLAAGGLAAGLVAGFVRTSSGDPAQVAAVVAMARHPAPSAAPPHHLMVARQEIDVRSYRVDGHLIVVATSARQFPMPSSSHVVQGSSQHAWMASSGSLGMYCVNQRPGQQSMLLVASMPAAELPQVAAGLHLI